jgi:hypothetical protein
MDGVWQRSEQYIRRLGGDLAGFIVIIIGVVAAAAAAARVVLRVP